MAALRVNAEHWGRVPQLAEARPLGLGARNAPTALQVRSMCNLYLITTNQEARAWLARAPAPD